MPEIGIIQEQGDLGIFNPLSQPDQKTYNEAVQREKEMAANQTVINENKDK